MKIRTLLMASVVTVSSAVAQIHSVQFFGTYSTALGKRIFVTKATSFGGGAEVRFHVGGGLFINLRGGYERYGIEQDSALARWNWRFWTERYAGIVRENLTTNPSLSATLTPVQYMEAIPLMLAVGMEFLMSETLILRTAVGGGAFFFTRSLYLDEQWQKRFDAQNHTFEYRYRNFASDKKGNPLVVGGHAEMAYLFAEGFSLDVSLRYLHVLSTPGKFGYNEVPLKGALSVMVGISFLY